MRGKYCRKYYVLSFVCHNPLSVPEHQHCELNCRAVGFRFYVRKSDGVIDGTPCGQNETSFCVAGKCTVGNCIDFLSRKNVLEFQASSVCRFIFIILMTLSKMMKTAYSVITQGFYIDLVYIVEKSPLDGYMNNRMEKQNIFLQMFKTHHSECLLYCASAGDLASSRGTYLYVCSGADVKCHSSLVVVWVRLLDLMYTCQIRH